MSLTIDLRGKRALVTGGSSVRSIAPGAIKTPINKSVWSDPQQMRDLMTKIPLNRIGQPEEGAKMVVVLATDVASYITATTIFVDGGMTVLATSATSSTG